MNAVGVYEDLFVRKELPVKRAPALTNESIELKVGMFESHTRLGRATQAVGSYILPGDTSRLRAPVRSAGARAITPGGGPRLGRPIGGAAGRMHCPAGFEFGGRFTDSNFSTCGAHIFSPVEEFSSGIPNMPNVPNPKRTIGATLPNALNVPRGGDFTGRTIRGSGFAGTAVAIRRNAMIPDVGAANSSREGSSIRKAISVLAKKDSGSILVRRDGIALKPNTGLAGLVKYGKNKDMEGGTIISRVTSENFGATEVDLLFKTPLKSVSFVLPGGGAATLTKTRDLTPVERRGLPRQWRNKIDASNIQEIADASEGVFKFTFTGKRSSNRKIQVSPKGGGATRTVPQWVYDTFLSADAPGRVGDKIWVVARD